VATLPKKKQGGGGGVSEGKGGPENGGEAHMGQALAREG